MDDKNNFANTQAAEDAERARQEAHEMEEALIQQTLSKAMKKPEYKDSSDYVSPEDLDFLNVNK